MAGERECETAVKAVHDGRPVGFAPAPVTDATAALPIVSAKVAAKLREVGEAAAQDLHRIWTGAGGNTFRKRAENCWTRDERERAEGYAAGARAGDQLVAALRRGAAVPRGAIADARERSAWLQDVAKAAEGWVSDARLADAEQLAEALAAPVPRADTPQLTAAQEGAAALAWTPEQIAAAIRSNDESWLERLRERAVVDAIKAVRGVRVGAAPPRFRA